MHALNAIAQLLSLVSLAALIWLVVLAFRKDILWGFAVLFLSPITATIYAIKHWSEAKKPFLLFITTLVSSIAIALYVFTAWGGWKLIPAAYEIEKGIQRKTLTEEQAITFLRNNLDFIENASTSEVDRQKVAAMRKVLERAESGFTKEEKREISQELSKLLRRSDLSTRDHRELEQIYRGAVAWLPEKPAALSTPDPAPDLGSQGPRYKAIPVAEARDYIGASVILIGRNDLKRKGKLIGVSGNTLRFERRLRWGRVSYDVRADDVKSLKVLLD